MSKREFQVTVPLDRSQREFIEAQAELEQRSLAAIVRRLVGERAARARAEREPDRWPRA